MKLLSERNRLKCDEEQPLVLASIINRLRASTVPVYTMKGSDAGCYPQDSEQLVLEDAMSWFNTALAMPNSLFALKEKVPPNYGAALPAKVATKQDNYFKGEQTKSNFVMAPTPPPTLPFPMKLGPSEQESKVLKPHSSRKNLHNNRYTKFEETVDLYPVECQPSALVKAAEKLDVLLRSSYISAPSPLPFPLPIPSIIQALPIVPAEPPDVIFPKLQDYMHQFAVTSLTVDSSMKRWSSSDSPSSLKEQVDFQIRPQELGTFDQINLVSH